MDVGLAQKRLDRFLEEVLPGCAAAPERGAKASDERRWPNDSRGTGDPQGGVGVAQGVFHLGLGDLGAEVLEDRGFVQADFAMADQVIRDPVARAERVGRARWAAEPVNPPEPGQAQAAPAELAEFLVDVSLFAAEAAEGRDESRARPTYGTRRGPGLAWGSRTALRPRPTSARGSSAHTPHIWSLQTGSKWDDNSSRSSWTKGP